MQLPILFLHLLHNIQQLLLNSLDFRLKLIWILLATKEQYVAWYRIQELFIDYFGYGLDLIVAKVYVLSIAI